MPPKFSLQNVLDVRHSRVEALEIELSKLMILQDDTQNKLDSLNAYRRLLMEKLSHLMEGDLDLFTVEHLRLDIRETSDLITLTEDELARVERMVEAKRDELVLAKQKEEALGILKKKRAEVYESEQAQMEARAQDDIYISLAYRSQL